MSSVSIGGIPPLSGGYGLFNGYFGQAGTEALSTHCDSGVDFVTLAFVNNSPENEPSGYPGDNFADHCYAGYYNNSAGVQSQLLSDCPGIQGSVGYCQQQGVKVLLSIGGEYSATSNYEVTTTDNGVEFATFLYKAFGPYDPTWDGPRPFDTADEHVAVDGFDFDIEADFDNAPYIQMISTLREFDSDILITGAPQCPTSDQYFYMKDMIQEAKFSWLNLQFYDNEGCDAIPGNSPGDSFNYDQWETIISNSSQSKSAKLFMGFPSYDSSGYLTPEQLQTIVCEYKDRPHFGGISIWDLSRGDDELSDGMTYNQHVYNLLNGGCPDTTTTTTTMSTTKTTSTVKTTSKPTTHTTTTTAKTTSTTTKKTTSTIKTTSKPTTHTTSTTGKTTSKPTTHTTMTTVKTTSKPTTKKTTTTKTTSEPTTHTTSTTTKKTTSTGKTTSKPTSKATSSTTKKTTSTVKAAITSPVKHDDSGTTSSTKMSGSPTAYPVGWNATSGTSSGVQMTTSVVFTTSVHTVTQCPVYVTNCPVGGYVTTETIALYTTICPVTATEKPTMTTQSPGAMTTQSPAAMTTSTVYTTSVHTVTACPPEVTNCPVGSVTTETIPLYTTICPVTATETGPAATSVQEETTMTEGTSTETGPAATSVQEETTTTKGTSTVYTTVTVPAPSSTTPEGTSTVYTTIIVPAPSSSTTGFETYSRPASSSTGCNGTGCPGVAASTTAMVVPSSPVTAGASTLAIGVTGLVAALAAQLFLL